MNSDDEAFNNFIVMTDSDESLKENVTVKQPKTSRQQFKLIAVFTDEVNEANTTKEIYDYRWDRLAEKLNNVGPAIHTSLEWRRIWTVYKYNRKRKLSTTQVRSQRRSSHQEPIDVRSDVASETAMASVPDESNGTVVEKLDEILTVLKESNGYLKRLAANVPK